MCTPLRHPESLIHSVNYNTVSKSNNYVIQITSNFRNGEMLITLAFKTDSTHTGSHIIRIIK